MSRMQDIIRQETAAAAAELRAAADAMGKQATGDPASAVLTEKLAAIYTQLAYVDLVNSHLAALGR